MCLSLICGSEVALDLRAEMLQIRHPVLCAKGSMSLTFPREWRIATGAAFSSWRKPANVIYYHLSLLRVRILHTHRVIGSSYCPCLPIIAFNEIRAVGSNCIANDIHCAEWLRAWMGSETAFATKQASASPH